MEGRSIESREQIEEGRAHFDRDESKKWLTEAAAVDIERSCQIPQQGRPDISWWRLAFE
jgi:hypothetical protein